MLTPKFLLIRHDYAQKTRRIMGRTAWWDMDRRGRRWEAIFKQMEKQFWKATNDGNNELAEAYFRRMSVIEKLIQPYVQEVTGLRKIISLHNKKYPELNEHDHI